jgi:hypothetical protein
MKVNHLLSIILLLILLYSCESNSKRIVKKSFSTSGKLLTYTEYLNDSTKDGVEINFYENGSLKSVFKYKNGLIEGINKSYLQDGTLIREESYKKGLRHGEFHFYYRNGFTKSQKNYYLGNQEGEDFEYNEKGEITSYSVYYADKQLFKAQYDSQGIITSYKRSPICMVFSNGNSNLNTDSIFRVEILLATPPLYKNSLESSETDARGLAIKPERLSELKNNIHEFHLKFITPGKKYWGCEYTLQSTVDTSHKIKDTFLMYVIIDKIN